ncbi:S9 family peptidase [Lunatibacter salilacus]|uniref:S9 family peptidase n=1 Tax=Lunatibacter salilacus TaxID=2483804 RepID=UPI00131B3C72|nr:S9 family peptidase [Lunatibacter salilacus]
MKKRVSKTPPKAKKINKTLLDHDHTRVDPFFWMNDREDPEVIAYLDAENHYTKAQLAHTEKFQQLLFDEMKGRIKKDDSSVPYFKSGYFYYHRFVTGGEYPIYCRKTGSLEADEEILLDVNELGKNEGYFQVGGLGVSEDGQLLCYAADNVGRRIYQLHWKDLQSGENLIDAITDTTGNFVWANDNRTVFYSKQDPETLRAYRIYKHQLGTSQEDDELVYEEMDETFTCHVKKSKSKAYIFIASQSTVSSEYRFAPADDSSQPFLLVQERIRDLEYDIEHVREEFYILTNAQDAKNFKLVKTAVIQPGMDNWEDVIPHRENVLLEGFELFNNHLVLEERFNGLTRLQVRSWDGAQKHYIKLDEPTYTVWTGYNPEFYTQVLRFGYNSLCIPNTTYDYDMVTREKTMLKQQEIVGGYSPGEYQSERCWAIAEDGTEVPISLVYKKALFQKSGKNPLLLYAYGSYGHSTDPTFSSSRLSLLDRGFVFAIAHIRGGQEMGRYWYENGKMLQKKNTFSDFIACAEFLIGEKYTSSDSLFAMGGSAGGLLMGTVINWRPDLFKGVVAAVPFVDVVTTMLDETIPLTTGEFDEWGNPKEKSYYDYMLSYSPYDNVKKQDYPHLLITTGLHDSQVQYWEPAKWIAKLRDTATGDSKILLHTNMEAGHGGASGRFRALRELAMEYAFILDLAGKSLPENK